MSEAAATLAERQEAFLRAILDESAPLPHDWGNSQAAGMAVYRGNYRGALLGALGETYERTARYVGDKAFSQASINHAIKHPPSGWTIDEAGAGFDATCAKMYPGNPEVAELAWLEWAMLELATAPDTQPFSAQEFTQASAAFGDEDWGGLRLALQPRARARLVQFDLTAIWKALGDGGEPVSEIRLPSPQTCLAWRDGERPTFILVEADHAPAFATMQGGGTYSDMIGSLLGENSEPSPEQIQTAAMRAGAILGRWLNEGIITGLNP